MFFNYSVDPWLTKMHRFSVTMQNKHFHPVLGEMKYLPSNGCSVLNSSYQNQVKVPSFG